MIWMECETIEIEIENSKNIFVNCICRAPDSCIDLGVMQKA